MINPSFQRLRLLIGADALRKLSQTKVLVFGLGGVGSWCAEALVRSGIGSISIIDFDKVDISNINRQVEATSHTIGKIKTEVLAARLKEINPDCVVEPISAFFSCKDEGIEKAAERFGMHEADYIIDAIDSIDSKLDLIESASRLNVVLYSSMGMARKLDPTRLRTADIWKTSGCPLARNVREGLRKRGFKGHFTVVYSDEKIAQEIEVQVKKKINGSSVSVTAAAGMILASLVIRDIHGGIPNE
jgi:tRNA A37 threonylcarbamoyladenosine dehydratase